MSAKPIRHRRISDKIEAALESVLLVLRALVYHRMISVLPLVIVLLLVASVSMTLGFISPLALLPRGAQVTPFIYPLF